MSDPATRFLDSIDTDFGAAESVVLRYRQAVRFETDDRDDSRFKQLLDRTSLGEGLRIVPLMEYRGVEIEVLDESSLMATGTLKSIDGCLAAARSLHEGFSRCVFESGGNTGSALTRYGAGIDLESYLVVPSENLIVLDSAVFSRPTAHLIAVDDPAEVKPTAARIASLLGVRRIPEAGWRYQSSTLIGCFVLEHFLTGAAYDVMAQTISAAFGPIGIYKVLAAFGNGIRLPRFFGIQQRANCPMARRWHGEADAPTGLVRSTDQLLSRVMYDSEPHTYGTYEKLEQLLRETSGDLDTIDHAEFYRGLDTRLGDRTLIEHLEGAGIRIGMRADEVIEKAGLIALLGTLKQVDKGEIEAGSRALVCLSGGTAQPDGLAVPDVRISRADEIDGFFSGRSEVMGGGHG